MHSIMPTFRIKIVAYNMTRTLQFILPNLIFNMSNINQVPIVGRFEESIMPKYNVPNFMRPDRSKVLIRETF